jgi:hypothetical protein
MAEPRKQDYSSRVGDVTQINFAFLNKLWTKTSGDQFRAALIAADQTELKRLLTEAKIEFIRDDPILVVDIENAKTNGLFDQPVGAPFFYVLVLPPRPRRHEDEQHYTAMQGWGAAYYHAINDSYGM